MATFTGIAGVVMVLLMTRNAANVTNAKGSVTQASVAPQIEIALTRPSESPLRVLAKKGAQLTVSDVAPQLGTAVVLSKSEITMPLGTSPAFAAAAKQATNDVVHKWLSSNDTLISFKSPSIAYVPTRKGFELKLPGKAVVWLPEEALKDGLSTKQAVLRTSRPRLDLALDRAMGLKLDDGSVVTLKSID
jgi:hypothetical protein